ncbi:hypothetical protein BDD12DRAFT_943943 [Trichophaea hybrida]|nr:hypothetical protein BDD12DRAFT_943943 [Trichophaea hybrida]
MGEWGTKKLDMLINNAAQTWTDLIETETLCVRREEQLCSSVSNGGLIIDTGYFPQVRGPLEYIRGFGTFGQKLVSTKICQYASVDVCVHGFAGIDDGAGDDCDGDDGDGSGDG